MKQTIIIIGIIFGFITIIIALSVTQGIAEMESPYSLFSPVYEAEYGVFITLIGGIILGIFSAIGSIRDD